MAGQLPAAVGGPLLGGAGQLSSAPSQPCVSFFLKFYWSIVDLQCVSFTYTAEWFSYTYCCCSVTRVVHDPWWPHGLRCASLPWPLQPPGACSDSCPPSQWCHLTSPSSSAPFSCLQSFPASGSFLRSWLMASGGQSIGASASTSVLPMNIQNWFPLGWTGVSGGWTALDQSMPQPVTLKKLKLNGSMKTYKTFWTNTPKRCPFHYRGLGCKSRKSRNTWSNRQVWPWSTEWSRAKGNKVTPRERTGHSKHPLPTTQDKTLHMDITRWSVLQSDWLYSLQSKMKNLYTVSKNKTRSDCGSYYELLITKLKSRENQQTVQVWPKSNPLRLYSGSDKWIEGIRSDRVSEELCLEGHGIVQETGINTIPKEKKAKWLPKKALQIAV